jgi:hypothetical protein
MHLSNEPTDAQIKDARRIASNVSWALRPSKAGVVLDVLASSTDLFYVLWTIGKNGRITEHCLDVSCTDEERLSAHTTGFIENHRAAFAA